MLKDVTIFIPSSGRSDRQVTLDQLPSVLLPRVMLAVPEREAAKYQASIRVVPVFSVPDSYKGISLTRKYLLEQCPTRYIGMVDDDMTFAYRPDMGRPNLVSLSPGSGRITNLFLYWRSLMNEYAHVGLSARQGNNRVREPIKVCCRMFNAYWYDKERVLAARPILGRLPVMEDFDLTLQLLAKGLPNAVIYRWCWNQGGSNLPGGCSQYRTGDMQRAAALELASLHPGLVRVVEKDSKNWGGGMERRSDVVISWKKALKT